MNRTMTREKDLVLVYYEDNPLAFARIERIDPDVKKDWYQVKLLILQIPPQYVTWILRYAYINGDEFTMGGKRMRIEKVVIPEEPEQPEEVFQDSDTEPQKGAKIITFPGKRKIVNNHNENGPDIA